MCGEQLYVVFHFCVLLGSPPRVRGTDRLVLGHEGGGGITPACAGNSNFSILVKQPFRDHPRVCGEQDVLDTDFADLWGSPPRVRGTGQKRRDQEAAERITPACAGNSRSLRSFGCFGWDHPRVCGEQQYMGEAQTYLVGSPPRVRGTDSFSLSSNRPFRITPACAGNRLTVDLPAGRQ